MPSEEIEQYGLQVDSLKVTVHILKDKPVPLYYIKLPEMSDITKTIIAKIREEIVSEVTFSLMLKKKDDKAEDIERQFKEKIGIIMQLCFSELDEKVRSEITEHLVLTSLGLGELEYLLRDDQLEEVVINGSGQAVWIYHRKYGWLKTDIIFREENRIRHFATVIARGVNKDITMLKPLLDAHLKTGDRVNATLKPISTAGNTITIRKFAEQPWTITDLILSGAISYEGAALIWLAIEYEQSIFVVGGTGSGKTTMLTTLANFFPPNQRIISIENTRELSLPKLLHWVPMETRLANQEGRGEITMLDLMVNSLRMRPDRIILGEIRRKEEVEVLLEAMRTGHSGYTTFHATTVTETANRLTNPPINLPKIELSTIGLIVVQFRDRRKGNRRTFQIAEVSEMGEPFMLMQYDMATDKMLAVNKPKRLYEQLKLFAGLDEQQILQNQKEKINVLQWLVKNKENDINKVGEIMGDYYTNKAELLRRIG